MIDIIAKWVDGKLLCGPKKRRGMTKGEYLRAVHVCREFNVISFQNLSSQELSLLSGKALDRGLSLQLFPSVEKNRPELELIVPGSPLDDDQQPRQPTLFYIPDR